MLKTDKSTDGVLIVPASDRRNEDIKADWSVASDTINEAFTGDWTLSFAFLLPDI